MRRDFLKKTGTGMAAASLASLGGCGPGHQELCTKPAGGRVIDVHCHVVPERYQDALKVMDDNFIRYGVIIGSLVGTDAKMITGDQAFYQLLEGIRPYRQRLGVMYSFDWSLIQTEPDFFNTAPDRLEKAVTAGGLGVKSFKDLGLEVKDKDGKLLPIDDPRLFPVWERAEKLGCVVAFHTGDPKPFFEPITPENERYEELHLHPEWSFADPAKYPKRDVILEQRNNVIRKFKNVKFQCVHVANKPEEIKTVAAWLEEMPNLYPDVAARLGEIGRLPAAEVHDVFTRFSDRFMFGTDRAWWGDCGVQGAGPCKPFTAAEDKWFYNTHWRYFQTTDQQFDHPTPVQGKWKINGIGLSEAAAKKLYWDNAYKLYKLDKLGVA